MQSFMNEDFLLETETARRLYHQYASPLPLVDYHCHIPPREIYEDRRFNDLGEAWLGGRGPDGSCFGDHYKWRLMRADGAQEEEVTGGTGFPRFLRFAQALEKAAGNPMVHWCGLELQRYFGITEPLTSRSAQAIWHCCNEKLRHDPGMTARGLIRQSHVEFIGTTDDPADALEWHEKLAADRTLHVKVCPSFRPDHALELQRPGFPAYLDRLARRAGRGRLDTAQAVAEALIARLEAFRALGCRASDHGLAAVPFRPGTPEQADAALGKALRGEPVSQAEAEIYQTYLLLALGRAYHRLGTACRFIMAACGTLTLGPLLSWGRIQGMIRWASPPACPKLPGCSAPWMKPEPAPG